MNKNDLSCAYIRDIFATHLSKKQCLCWSTAQSSDFGWRYLWFFMEAVAKIRRDGEAARIQFFELINIMNNFLFYSPPSANRSWRCWALSDCGSQLCLSVITTSFRLRLSFNRAPISSEPAIILRQTPGPSCLWFLLGSPWDLHMLPAQEWDAGWGFISVR